jgi:nucleotide-binding universal stress UspA family protein
MKEFKFNPIRRILVPTDFSPNAGGAVNYAAALAARLGSRLILFHSVHIPLPVGNEPVVVVSDRLLMDNSETLLNELRTRIAGQYPGLNIEVLATQGFAVEEIIGLCSSKEADLIVMGTRGAHGLGEILIGSNTAEVISRSRCPVLAVPEEAHMNGIRKLLFATNYADQDFQSVFLLTEIFKPWNPEIIIVHAGDGNAGAENSQFEWFKGQVVTSISYDRFCFNLINGKNAEQAISEFAKENEVDLITVSTRRRNLFERLTSRSISRKLVYHTDIPLLAFHADGSALN